MAQGDAQVLVIIRVLLAEYFLWVPPFGQLSLTSLESTDYDLEALFSEDPSFPYFANLLTFHTSDMASSTGKDVEQMQADEQAAKTAGVLS